MKLYHGSCVVVQNPDVDHSREKLDFGRGFYHLHRRGPGSAREAGARPWRQTGCRRLRRIPGSRRTFQGISTGEDFPQLHSSPQERAICFPRLEDPSDEAYVRQRHRLPVTSTLHTALGELIDAGLVDRTPEQIRLADPLFAYYIRGKITTVFANK